MKKINYLVLFAISGISGFCLSLYLHAEKTPPLASPKLMQTFHYPTTFVKQLVGDPHAGEKIYKEFCASCHAPHPVIQVNAPKLGDEKRWRPLRQLGLPKLLKMTCTGVGAMPARGGCFECSDEQLLEAIKYLSYSHEGRTGEGSSVTVPHKK